MFIGFQGSSKENKIDSYNHWAHQDHDFECLTQLSDDPYDEKNRKSTYFVSSNSAKDPEYDSRYPGGSTVCIIGMAKRSWFENCTRDEDYRSIKEHLKKVYLEEALYRIYPHLRGVPIDYSSFATALTNKKYLKTMHGSIYGLNCTVDRFTTEGWNLTDPVGPVPGLTFAGQDMISVGIASAISSGMLTAWRKMGYLYITDIFKGIDVERDFRNFELYKQA
jgi:all-trans-retinol 13,14-reductase